LGVPIIKKEGTPFLAARLLVKGRGGRGLVVRGGLAGRGFGGFPSGGRDGWWLSVFSFYFGCPNYRGAWEFVLRSFFHWEMQFAIDEKYR